MTRTGLLLACAASVLLSACSSVTDTEESEAARITVTGTSTVPLLLITSTEFIAGPGESGDPVVNIVNADTVSLSLPIDRTLSLTNADRFYIKIRNPSTESATVDMRISVDGEEVYRQAATLREADLIFIYFLF